LIDEARMKNNKSFIAMAFVTNQNWCCHFSVHTVRRLIMRNPCALSNTLIRRRNSMQLELQRRRANCHHQTSSWASSSTMSNQSSIRLMTMSQHSALCLS
jgi:hypothetical protein